LYDVAVVGAGPAGATLARLLGERQRVLLVDMRRLDQAPENDVRVKACGGLIAPQAQKAMAEAGLGLPLDVLVGPQLFAVRTFDLLHNIEQFYQRFYINVDRERFDRWVVSLVPSGVDTRFGVRLRSVERLSDGGFQLTLLEGADELVFRAKVLVGADGARSFVRRWAFPDRPSPREYIARQEWYEVGDSMPYYTAVFDPEVTDFYGWTIPKGRHLLLGVALEPQKSVQERFDLLKGRLEKGLGMAFGPPVRREGAFIYRALSVKQTIAGAASVALIGEAAGFISPSSAEGLSYAIKSATLLAESLGSGLEGFEARYSRLTRGIRFNIWYKNRKGLGMYNPLLRRVAMKSDFGGLTVAKGGS